MTAANFSAMFHKATGNPRPFPYQERFATAEELPELVHAPTGAGKTATAILGWLWRLFHTKKPMPRRLVYCLPMRVLVEQTRDEAIRWLHRLELLDAPVDFDPTKNDRPMKYRPLLDEATKAKVAVHVLMGGEDAVEWDLYPERPAVLIGTQDMLLSRALNRGYGMGRFRWPMHFGLLNNDSLWVLDEIQLMGTGLATSTQLQAFREALGTFGTVKTVWMSATLLPGWLASVDYRKRIEPDLRLDILALEPKADYLADGLQERWNAEKPLLPADVPADNPGRLADFVRRKHLPGSLTLVILNTVDRARDLFEAIRELYSPPKPRKGAKATDSHASTPSPDLRLIHSRFRPIERDAWRNWLTQKTESLQKQFPAGRIVISTQVVEAGVDLSAQTLITELAPWPGLVQRFGRCNRRGEFKDKNSAQLFWVDVPTPDEKNAAPYSKDEMDAARERIRTLTEVGLKSLTAFFDGLGEPERKQLFPFDPAHVIRRKDFIELFDTTPDLAGNDLDVSRFIRDGDDIDVQVFWRATTPPVHELTAAEARRLAPKREELCPVKLARDGGIRGFLDSHTAYRWDSLESTWAEADASEVYPGQIYWIATAEGGYDAQLGWSPDTAWSPDLPLHDPDANPASETTEEPGYDTDLLSLYGWRSIAEHSGDVIEELDAILANLTFDELPQAVLGAAARWHDWGKAHHVFQDAIRDEPEAQGKRPWERKGKRDIAKAAPKEFWQRYKRRHFRHELASALGVLTLLNSARVPDSWAGLDRNEQNLALYLIAAHHGKVRLSIRSMPNETTPIEAERLFARGVWQGDDLPSIDLGGGVTAPAAKLDLSPMTLGCTHGHSSWCERTLRLRDERGANETQPRIGPIKMAYLEVVLRAADMRASKAADDKAKTQKGVES
jgi:CRISPR-associated endonuclease/helicase Cas3